MQKNAEKPKVNIFKKHFKKHHKAPTDLTTVAQRAQICMSVSAVKATSKFTVHSNHKRSY